MFSGMPLAHSLFLKLLHANDKKTDSSNKCGRDDETATRHKDLLIICIIVRYWLDYGKDQEDRKEVPTKQRALQDGIGKKGRKEGCSTARGDQETPPIQARDCGPQRDPKISKVNRAPHQEITVPKTCSRDRPRHKEWLEVPGKRRLGTTRSIRGPPSWHVPVCKSVCYPCQAYHHHAKGYSACQEDSWRKNLTINCIS